MPEIEVTPHAVEVLKRSLALAPHAAGVRLVARPGLGGTTVQVELADGAGPGEAEVEADGIRLFIDPELTKAVPNPIVTVETEHERIAVRPRPDRSL